MARLKVRKCLDQKLILKVNQLPIPQTLKDYVSMIDIFGVSTKTSSSSNLNNNNKHNCQLEEINHEYPSNKDMGFNIEDNCFKMNHKLQNKLPDHQPFFMPKQAVERATNSDGVNFDPITIEAGSEEVLFILVSSIRNLRENLATDTSSKRVMTISSEM